VSAAVPVMAHAAPGDLLYTRSSGPVGALIRFGQDVELDGWVPAFQRVTRRAVLRDAPLAVSSVGWGNHIAFVSDGCLIEALGRGLTRSPPDKYGAAHSVVLRLDQALPGVTGTQRAAAVRFAEHELETHAGYSWLAIASIIVQLTTPTRFDLSWDGAMICSAFGARCWEHAGVILRTRSACTTMPAQLRQMVHL